MEYNIGTHIKKEKTFFKSLTNYFETNSIENPVQIFTGSPQSWSRSKRNSVDEDETKKYITENKIKLYIHSQYLINLAKTVPIAINSLQNDLDIGAAIGASGVVVHVGKYCKNKPEECLDIMEENMKSMQINETCPLLLETPAGQGTELLTKLEDFEEFMKRFEEFPLNYGICVDTCHVFAAGYDPLDYISKLSLEINLIHLNDSKEKLGSKKDRHETIGEGFIGEKILLEIASKNIPCLTE